MRLRAATSSIALIALLCPLALAQNITFNRTDKDISYPIEYLTQGDINRDGYPDFLFGLTDSLNIYVYKSDGVGDYVDWTIPTHYCPSEPLGLGDFQRNDRQDLLVSPLEGQQCVTYNPTFADYVNNGSGIFHLYKSFPLTFTAAQAAVIADFNGDHKLDAIIIDGQKRLEIYYGDGYGGFAGPFEITRLTGSAASLTASFYNLITGDFDGNGCPDVAWTEYEAYGQHGFQSQLKIAYGDFHGHFSIGTHQNIIGEIDNLQTIDLNRDGISDIVSTLDAAGEGVTNPTLQIFYGHKNRTFTTRLIRDPSLVGPINAADFNGDGYPDIAYMSTTASSLSIKILHGDAKQSFSTVSTYSIGSVHSLYQLVSGDYNRDGKTDLALLAVKAINAGFDLMMLRNTSAYPDGTCVPPTSPGIKVCSPGTTSGQDVRVLADGNNSNPTVYMELWVDGVRRFGYGSTHELRGSLTLSPGKHQFAFYAVDAAGNKSRTVKYVTVQ